MDQISSDSRSCQANLLKERHGSTGGIVVKFVEQKEIGINLRDHPHHI